MGFQMLSSAGATQIAQKLFCENWSHATTQAILLGVLCGQYAAPMVLKYNYLIQYVCSNMKVILQLSGSFIPET